MTDNRPHNPDIEICIKRSKRKSIVGRVVPNGNIEVRAPLSTTTDDINKFLDKYEHKFLPIVAKYREMSATVLAHPFGYGGEVLLLGKWLPIKEAADDNNGYWAQYKDGAFQLKPDMSEDNMRYHISDVMYELAQPIFEEKLHHYSDLMGVNYRAWTIGSARKVHGSCRSDGKITLSWRIIMMSEQVIEYIIVHELAHIKHMNHAKVFRDEVAAVLPDWEERRKAHGEYGFMLRCCGWI